MNDQSIATKSKKAPTANRRVKVLGVAAALIASLHWCHPPTPDIKIFDWNNGGQQAIESVVAERPDGVL